MAHKHNVVVARTSPRPAAASTSPFTSPTLATSLRAGEVHVLQQENKSLKHQLQLACGEKQQIKTVFADPCEQR